LVNGIKEKPVEYLPVFFMFDKPYFVLFTTLSQITPRFLFLVDSIGALTTAVLVYFLVGRFPEFFGFPIGPIILLAVIAGCFCLYSFSCYVWVRHDFKRFFKLIIWANASYCVLTLVILFLYRSTVTMYSIIYFSMEILIICVVIRYEWKTLTG
jgi:hypothetical protein